MKKNKTNIQDEVILNNEEMNEAFVEETDIEEGTLDITQKEESENLNIKKRDPLKSTTLYIAKIAVLSAVAFILMYVQFPIFPAFAFLQIDFANIPALIGGFLLNPLAAFIIEIIKIVCAIVVKGTMTGYVGELSNLIVSLAFVLPPTIMYHYRKTLKMAVLGLSLGVVVGTIIACLSNYFLVFPLYLKGFGEGILQGKSLENVIWAVVLPFNIIKMILNSILTLLLYKQTGYLLRRF